MKMQSLLHLLPKALALSACVCVAATTGAQTNLLVNPGFSSGTQGWSTNCTIEINPETVYGGTNASNPVSEIDIERCFYQEVAVIGGTIYDFGYKASRRQGGTPATVGVNVRITGVQSGVDYLNTNRTYTNTSWNYTNESFSFTIPSNTTDTRVRIRFSNYITTGTYGTLIDDIRFSVNAQSAVLPIKLTGFTAAVKNRQSLLSWTAQDNENDGKYFIIERAGAQHSFDSIGRVTVTGSGVYSFTDMQPLNGASQYRLKAINKDGSYTYSKVVSVENTLSAAALNLYPNPATTQLNCSVTSDNRTVANLFIYTISGRLVASRKLELEKGANALAIDITALKPGSFYLRIMDGAGGAQISSFSKS